MLKMINVLLCFTSILIVFSCKNEQEIDNKNISYFIRNKNIDKVSILYRNSKKMMNYKVVITNKKIINLTIESLNTSQVDTKKRKSRLKDHYYITLESNGSNVSFTYKKELRNDKKNCEYSNLDKLKAENYACNNLYLNEDYKSNFNDFITKKGRSKPIAKFRSKKLAKVLEKYVDIYSKDRSNHKKTIYVK